MNKIVVITGGTSGIGKEMFDLFKAMGNTVISLAKDVDEPTEFSLKCDVSNEDMVKECVNSIGAKYGRIDILINCAGYGISGALELISTQQAKQQFDVNMHGAFMVNKYAIKYMQKGGTIVHIASACALFALPFRGLYCASKSALNMYSDCLRLELKPLGINVVSICPGDVKTNFTKNRVKIFDTNERYGNRIANAAYNIDKNQEKRMEPLSVAKKIVKISLKKKPKPMYIIGAKYKLLYFTSRVFPKSAILYFTDKMFGGKKRKD
ncbi:MAG: SDR family NAD(P)-dependent oxidoreductase [Christensenellales bacterium]